MQQIDILECTLRDGSYSIDFQFTPTDTAIISGALESAGIRMIEIGHGLGLNATCKGRGQAAGTDVEYMQAAGKALTQAKWGMFFIPGIGNYRDIDMITDHAGGFLRIGVNAPDIRTALPYIEYAAKKDLRVFCNFMKSYAVSAEELAGGARLAASAGAHGVYLVDSAGFMLPADVTRYIEEIRTAVDITIGFHGHDNLSMGCANCLAAVPSGAQIVDATLMGLGRGGGNPATEILNVVLQKADFETGIDTNRTCDIGFTFIKRLFACRTRTSLDIACGRSGFHSSFLDLALECAQDHDIDPRDLIEAVCRVDMISPDEALMRQIAGDIDKEQPRMQSAPDTPSDRCVKVRKRQLSPTLARASREMSLKLHNIGVKTRRKTVLNIVGAREGGHQGTVSEYIHEDLEFVLCNIVVVDIQELKEIHAATDGLVDFYFADITPLAGTKQAPAGMLKNLAKSTQVIGYDDREVLRHCLERQIMEIIDADPLECDSRPLLIHGGLEAAQLSEALARQGYAFTVLIAPDDTADATLKFCGANGLSAEYGHKAKAVLQRCALIVTMSFESTFPEVWAQLLPRNCCMLDAVIGAVQEDALQYMHQNGIRILRPDMRAALNAEIQLALNTRHLHRNCQGEMMIEGVRVVAGGVVGRRGDIVVDEVPHPTKIVGVADGAGRIIRDTGSNTRSLNIVESYIRRNLILSDIQGS